MIKVTGSLHTIRAKITVGIVILVLFLTALLILNNYYAIGVVRNQVSLSYKHMISMSINQIDESLYELDQYMQGIIIANDDFITIKNSANHDAVVFSAVSLKRQLSATLSTNSVLMAFFICDMQKGFYMDISKPETLFSERRDIKSYLETRAVSGVLPPDQWTTEKIGEEYYAFRMFQSDHTYIGAWFKINAIQKSMNQIDVGENGEIFFIVPEMVSLSSHVTLNPDDLNLLAEGYMTGGKPNYYLTGQQFRHSDLVLAARIPDDVILESLPGWVRTGVLLIVGILLMIPVILLVLQQVITKPMKEMARLMRSFGMGQSHVRYSNKKQSQEFQIMGQEFNLMAEKIETLQISVLKEQIEKKRAELQHLQLQLNPHFFINSLNTVYSFATAGDTQAIQTMALSLSRYFRHIFKNNLSFVTLEAEIGHIENYLNIQQIRYPGKFLLMLSVDLLKPLQIPALCLHTFVENTVKYQSAKVETIEIHIECSIIFTEKVPMARLLVYDNGEGYPDEVLSRLNQGKFIIDENGEQHIGIWNLIKRMELLYKGEAKIRLFHYFDNGTGAAAELILPIRQEEEKL